MHKIDLDQHYINKIRNLPLLTQEEEYKLAKQWKNENNRKAMDKLISSHLKLVTKIALGYRGYGLPLSDLIAEGNIGMIQAMKHYDPDKGFRLSTYAMWWIKARIRDYVMGSWSMVKIGTTAAQKKLFFNLRKTQRSMTETESNELTPEIISSIANKLSVPEYEVKQMYQRMSGKDSSLNALLGDDSDSGEWIEWMADERDNQEIRLVHLDEMQKKRNLFDQAIKCLDRREHAIFIKRRLQEPPDTLEEISNNFSISRERVRQIEHAVFLKIQKEIKRLSKDRI